VYAVQYNSAHLPVISLISTVRPVVTGL